jgi:predicted DNA-binding WGR domain protein
MTVVTLRRIDPTRNMRRFYRLALQPDLFGDWGVVREWGRIGQAGRVRVDSYPSEIEAAARMQRQRTKKQGRGYALFTSPSRESTVRL